MDIGHEATDTELAFTPMSQAPQRKPVPNVAFNSPHEVAIECFLGCLGQLSRSH